MTFRLTALAVFSTLLHATIVGDVRRAIAQDNLAAAEKLVEAQPRTPEALEAYSWLGRGSLAAKRYEDAERFAAETRKRALALLAGRKLDAERHLPIALGAAIEVQAHVLVARGERDQAVTYLQDELKRYFDTSIRTRIQKNIHLFSLEGKPAPQLDLRDTLGPKFDLKGKPALLFLWAHWCGDCKQQAPILEKVIAEYSSKGLVVVGPTQYYGYVEAGREAEPAAERQYIENVFAKHYSTLKGMPVPVSNENFKIYGASTTPTLVLIDRTGIVRLYHPGKMTYEALSEKIDSLLR